MQLKKRRINILIPFLLLRLSVTPVSLPFSMALNTLLSILLSLSLLLEIF
jgi:hypothetical protein